MGDNEAGANDAVRLWVIGWDGDKCYLLSPVGDWDAVQHHPRPLGIGVWLGEHDFSPVPNLHSLLSRTQYYPFREVPPEQTEQWLHDFIGYTDEDVERMIARVRRILAERDARGTTRGKYSGRKPDDDGD